MRDSTKIPSRPRGRPRTFDPDVAMGKVTETFWATGFSATSMDALAEATGMNRPSLYGAFGDKRALYLSALENYVIQGRAAMEDALSRDEPLAKAMKRVYDLALALYYPDNATARGCFLIGTAATESVSDEGIRAILGDGLRDFDAAFEMRLKRARDAGEIDASGDPAVLAKIASAILHTLALRSRAGDSRESLEMTAAAGIEMICGAKANGKKRK